MHCLYVCSDTTIDPMCVQAANALMRLCICPGSSELSMLAYKQTSFFISWHIFQIVFCDFMPKEEAIS